MVIDSKSFTKSIQINLLNNGKLIERTIPLEKEQYNAIVFGSTPYIKVTNDRSGEKNFNSIDSIFNWN